MNLFLVKDKQIQFSFWLTGFVVFALYYVPCIMCHIIKINLCYSNYIKKDDCNLV